MPKFMMRPKFLFLLIVFYILASAFIGHEIGSAVQQFQGLPGWHKLADWWTKP